VTVERKMMRNIMKRKMATNRTIRIIEEGSRKIRTKINPIINNHLILTIIMMRTKKMRMMKNRMSMIKKMTMMTVVRRLTTPRRKGSKEQKLRFMLNKIKTKIKNKRSLK
jgi:hypothetical protein